MTRPRCHAALSVAQRPAPAAQRKADVVQDRGRLEDQLIRELPRASTTPMSRDAALIEAAAKQLGQQAAIAMERASTRGERAQARQLGRAAASLARSSGRPLGSNRRSPREIQEIIRAVFAAHPTRAFPTKDLCDILYPDQPTRVHIVKTSHAARQIVAADPHWTCEFSADRRQVVFFNRANESSLAIAAEMLAPKPKRPRMRRPPRPRHAAGFWPSLT
jgi:hypothetical protein